MKFKFRIWDDERRKMCNNPQFDYTEGIIDNVYHPNGAQINKFKIMQYTNVKDKNGKEICEKDIVKFSILGIFWCNPKDFQNDMRKGIIKSKYGVFGIEYSSWSEQENFIPLSDFYYEKEFHNIPKNDLEVIGNIYEDKHLLDNIDMAENQYLRKS